VMSRIHRGRLELAERISLPSQNTNTYTRADSDASRKAC
jgi:hypothetical protein